MGEGSVIHVPYSRSKGTKRKDFFIFYYGVVVFWGLDELEERKILRHIERFGERKLSEEEEEDDFFVYTYGTTTAVYNNAFVIEEDNNVLIKFSLSHGIAQSTKLGVFENNVMSLIDRTRSFPEELASTGKVKLKQRDVHRLLGECFVNYSSMNIHRDILNLPSFFWEYDEYEKYYKMAWNYLDTDQRLNVLEQKLDIIAEFIDLLSDELEFAKMYRLSWIVMILLVADIVVLLAKTLLVH